MTANTTSSTNLHPIRELIWPDLEQPIQQLDPENERRRYHRYSGHDLPARMIVDETEYPITCVDIGYGGMHVTATSTMDVAVGQRVVIRIVAGARTFQDEFSVQQCQPTADGTSIHLAL